MSAKDDGLLTAICQGLSAYQAYLATCNMHSVRSEYLFYEPIARIAQTRGWTTKCEFEVHGFPKAGPGDYRRVDFVFEKSGLLSIAAEVKYLTSKTVNHRRALENLGASDFKEFDCHLLVLGSYKHVHAFKPKLDDTIFKSASPCRKKIGMQSGGIKYAATWFRLQ